MKSLRICTGALALALLCLLRPALAQENLVVNGGFEEPRLDNCDCGGMEVPLDTPGIGWSVQGHSQFGLGRLGGLIAAGPVEGTQHYISNAGKVCTLSQNLQTIPGATYELKFSYAPRKTVMDYTFLVFWGGQQVASYPIPVNAPGEWHNEIFQLQAPAETTELKFTTDPAPNIMMKQL
ncbi:MAG: hypothetical protein IT369_11035, partial [Candidatus Latescibacteria bacterium]|nr:hypothetical protein [Candidatus Latescibacterota bacterium]